MARAGNNAWHGIGVVLLAAGHSRRFGGDKLAAPLAGKPLLRHAAELAASLPAESAVVVLGPETLSVTDLGLDEVRLRSADHPQAHSLAAGVRHIAPAASRGLLVLLADMPLVSRAHVHALVHAFDGRRAICSTDATIRCPPAIFPPTAYPALLAGTGDQGARALLTEALCLAAEPGSLRDVDRPEDLSSANQWLRAAAAPPFPRKFPPEG